MFVREDWKLFCSLETLGQKAGVARERIARLVLKELVDNALDGSGECAFGRLDGDGVGFFVEDHRAGIPGTDEEIAHLFSVGRPLVSSKLLRLPTRGALGNGLRVVAGAVYASAGHLIVSTRGRSLRLRPKEDGTTTAERVGPYEGGGTRVECRLGPAVPADEDLLTWAGRAQLLSVGTSYRRRSSAYWYDSDAFHELCRAAGSRTVRDLVTELEGCSGRKAGEIAEPRKERLASSLARDEAERVLLRVRSITRPVKAARLGEVGPMEVLGAYARTCAVMVREPVHGRMRAELPVIVEAWARPDDGSCLVMHVNRTPITAEIEAYHQKTDLVLFGCGLRDKLHIGRRPLAICLNIQTPFMPITNDGKAPDLAPIVSQIEETLGKAIRRARRLLPSGTEPKHSQKDLILAALPAAIAKAGGDGEHRFSLRQLFYAVRPALLEALGKEPSYDYFAQVVTDHEGAKGEDIPGMYRDARGTLYHPHTGEEIPLGTLAVERYERPEWTFNKILYCEKEGFFPLLREVKWPERHDCALLTSKGYASRAARDVIDLIGESGEEITFFAIHDADGPGTQIYEALQQGTRARPGRRVKIINLGLEPEEALAMGLQVESFERKGRVPVAEYVPARWVEWLQEHRVELNAMTTPQFIAWLDRKLGERRTGKLVPPPEVLAETLADQVRDKVDTILTAKVLTEARLEEQVEAAVRALAPRLDDAEDSLEGEVRSALTAEPERHWPAPVEAAADRIVGEWKAA